MFFRRFCLVALILTIVLISGCINIDVQQKIKRDGNYDMDLTISTSPEYKMILNGLKEGFQVDDSVKDKFEYSETETSVTYSFKDLDFQNDKKIFKEIESKEEDMQDLFGETPGTTDSSFLDPENTEFKREFKFPYYVYIYKIIISPEIEEGKKEVETLSQNEYILDEANILDQTSKTQITQSINNIHKNDSIELIILTKEQMESKDYFSYKFEFTSNFEFKNKNKQYILIFVSTNENGLCKVESNIFMDSKFTSKIRTLNTDFSKNCKPNYKNQITNVVTQLDNFFKQNDLESQKQVEEQLGELFKIGYTVEVFGKITETNGLKMEDNKIKFDINPAKGGEYTVTFKDFFLITILGNYYWVYLLIIGIILLGIMGFIIFSKIKINRQNVPLQAPLAVNPQIVDYVKKSRMYGITDAQIKNKLIQSGWSSKEVDIALKSK